MRRLIARRAGGLSPSSSSPVLANTTTKNHPDLQHGLGPMRWGVGVPAGRKAAVPHPRPGPPAGACVSLAEYVCPSLLSPVCWFSLSEPRGAAVRLPFPPLPGSW